MRYYLYISDAKVDMLLPQVPGALQKRVATKLGFDIKFVSASITSETNTLDNRIARLRIVEEFIRLNEPVGEQEEITSWIQGEADATLVDLGSGAIMFLIKQGEGALGLGGSAHHLIGSQAAERTHIPSSLLPRMAHRLVKVSERIPGRLLGLPEKHTVDEQFRGWAEVMDWIVEEGRGIPQRITFLAKRLVSETDRLDRSYTLASPLFVAAAD